MYVCLLYTSDAADDGYSVDLGGRRIIKKIFFKQKTAYEISEGLVGSEMCIRDRGEIVYIHPTNGWMTVRITTAYTRTKKRESGKVIWAYMPYKLHETYMASMWFDEAFRCSAVTPTKDIKNCWAEVRASDSDARAS